MSKASKGRSFEHAVRKLFEDDGFSVVRGAGSKGEMLEEKVDLVCTKRERINDYRVMLYVIGCQCKCKARARKKSDHAIGTAKRYERTPKEFYHD